MSNENINETVNEAPKPGTKAYMEAELAAAKAELEALKTQLAENSAAKAELEALKTQLAENSAAKAEPEAPVVPADERVDLFVEKGYANDEPNLQIIINGVNYLLPKGKTSNVPKFVADEYYRSRSAQRNLDDTVDKMLAEASK